MPLRSVPSGPRDPDPRASLQARRPTPGQAVTDVTFLVLAWIALGLAFTAGAVWGGKSYERGYRDGIEVGERIKRYVSR